MITQSRRGFIAGLSAALCAPAIVRAEVLMPLRGIVMPIDDGISLLSMTHPDDFDWERNARSFREAVLRGLLEMRSYDKVQSWDRAFA